jgi:hypothetical protein
MNTNPIHLVNDAGFQQAVGSDEELNRLFHEQAAELPLKDAELLVAISGKILIAGKQFPAPTAGTISLLEIIESPFISTGESNSTMDLTDAFEALLILKERKAIAIYLLAIKKYQLTLERLQEKAKTDQSPELAEAVVKAAEKLDGARTYFSNLASQFAQDEFGDTDISSIFDDLQMYLGMSGGYDMLPSQAFPGTTKKNRRFDADWLTHIVATVTEVSNATPDDIVWRSSMSTTSFLVMQAMRKAGVKGIAEKTKSAQAMARLKQLMVKSLNKKTNPKP